MGGADGILSEAELEAFSRDARHRRRQGRRKEQGRRDAEVPAATATGSRTRREDAPLAAPASSGPVGVLARPRRCYVCKNLYDQVDASYHLLCAAGQALRSP